MLWKVPFFALFAIEVLTLEKQMSEEQKKKFEESLKKYCKDNGAENLSDDALTAIRNTGQCIAKIVNPNEIKDEIDEAKSEGTMNELMERYCFSANDLKKCIHTMTENVVVCMSKIVQTHIVGYNSAIDAFIDYACDDRKGTINIATFVSKGGVDCIKNKIDAIKGCSAEMENNVFWEHCDQFDNYTQCQIEVSKECPDPAIADLVEDLLLTIRAESPCDDIEVIENKTKKRKRRKKKRFATAALRNPPTTPTATTWSRRRSTTRERIPDKDPMAKYTMSEKQRKKFRAAMTRYCLQNGGTLEDADDVEVATRNLLKCATNMVNPKRLKREMDMAMPFGKKVMQKVFGKYCEKTFNFKNCVFGMTKKAANCMTDETRYQLEGYDGIVDVVINFWCHNGAERLAVFFTSAHGPKCIENTYRYLMDCTVSIERGTVFWENCDTFEEFAACIVKELLACSKREVSLLAGKLLKEIYDASPCRDGGDGTFKLK